MAAEEPHDFELMAAIAQRDESAFALLIDRHQREVYGTIVKMLGDPIEAEDLAQRVFLRIWQAAPRYQPKAQFRTWLFTIVRNLVFNESHRRARHRTEPLLNPEEEEGRGAADWQDAGQPNPAEETLKREKMSRVDAAIHELPSPQRLAVLLYAHQDMSYEEIAQVLKTSVAATKSLLFRARETLRRQLNEWLEK
jgi:RNA polymerase sigma-70 factor, ECF subfamily